MESAMEMQGSRDGRSRPLPGESSPAGSSSLGGAGHRTPEPVRGARHGGEGRCHCVLGPGGQFLMADLLNPFFVPPNQKLFVPPGSYTLAELRGAVANHAAPAAEAGSTPIRVTRGGRRPPRPRRLGRLRGVPQVPPAIGDWGRPPGPGGRSRGGSLLLAMLLPVAVDLAGQGSELGWPAWPDEAAGSLRCRLLRGDRGVPGRARPARGVGRSRARLVRNVRKPDRNHHPQSRSGYSYSSV